MTTESKTQAQTQAQSQQQQVPYEKLERIFALLREVAWGTHVQDVEDALRRLLAPTLTDVRKYLMDILKLDKDRIEKIVGKYIEKCLEVWERYHARKVTYSPEMSFVIPYAWGSRTPLIQWKSNISDRNMKTMRYLLQECGMCICAGFRGLRRIVMVDIDLGEDMPMEEKANILAQVLDHATSLGLPCKVTWHLGVHIYIPADPDTYPLGLVILHEQGDKKEYFLNHSPITLVNETGNVKLEVRIDYVTHHPLQSWLFTNLDKINDEVEENPQLLLQVLEDVKVLRCGIPETGPSLNWFKYGMSIRKRDVPDLFTDLVSRLVRDLKLCASVRGKARVEKLLEPKLVEADAEVLEKAIEAPRGTENFPCGTKGKELYIASPYHEGLNKLFILRENTLHEVLQILQELDRYGIAPRCVMKFLVEGLSKSEGKFVHSILAWYLLQQMFPIDEQLLFEISIESARVRKLRVPKLYYYEYFGTRILTYTGRDNEQRVYYARPRAVPLLKEALKEACACATVCGDCAFRNVCCDETTQSAGLRLTRVVNLIAFEILYGKASSSTLLRSRLNPRVVQRLMFRRTIPLPRPVY